MNILKKVLLCYFIIFTSYAEDKQLNTKNIEKIIENYLLENPEVLIKSLGIYREKQLVKEKKQVKTFIAEYYETKDYENLPFTGNNTGSTIITEFIDYNCGYCKKTLLSINKLLEKYKDVKVVFVDFPILSETSLSAAKAALAASKQNAYFAYHSALLKNNKKINDDYLIKLAKTLKLDLKKFKDDMASDEIVSLIEKNIEFARNLNIRGTPSFIINKKMYPGAYDFNKLEKIINNS